MSQASSASYASSLSLTSISYNPSRTTSTVPTTVPGSSSSSHRRAAAIAGSIAALCIVATLLLLSLLFWRRRKRRVLRSQQMAIRRMTIVGPPPPSTPPPLPYSFTGTGSGHRHNFFSGMSFSGIGDFEISAAKNSSKFGDNEAGLQQTNVPAPTLPKGQDRAAHEQRRTPGVSTVPSDSASVYSGKQSENGEDDRMVLVNGVYVFALNREDGHSDVERDAKPKRPSD